MSLSIQLWYGKFSPYFSWLLLSSNSCSHVSSIARRSRKARNVAIVIVIDGFVNLCCLLQPAGYLPGLMDRQTGQLPQHTDERCPRVEN